MTRLHGCEGGRLLLTQLLQRPYILVLVLPRHLSLLADFIVLVDDYSKVRLFRVLLGCSRSVVLG